MGVILKHMNWNYEYDIASQLLCPYDGNNYTFWLHLCLFPVTKYQMFIKIDDNCFVL